MYFFFPFDLSKFPSTKCIGKQVKPLSLQYYVIANGWKMSLGGIENVVKLDYGADLITLYQKPSNCMF